LRSTALPIGLRQASLRRWPLVMNGRALTDATGPFHFSLFILHLSFDIDRILEERIGDKCKMNNEK
jgi:hypothetical protein